MQMKKKNKNAFCVLFFYKQLLLNIKRVNKNNYYI